MEKARMTIANVIVTILPTTGLSTLFDKSAIVVFVTGRNMIKE